MSDLQVFNNPEFGEVRAVEIGGEPWFVGKDVAAPLGYANPSKAIVDHVDDEDKRFEMMPVTDSQNGNLVKTALISESGVYSLIFSSRLESAKKFKRWVTAEVLPAIRKHGAYLAPQAQVPAAMEAAALQAVVQPIAAAMEALAKSFDAQTAILQALARQTAGRDEGRALPPPEPRPGDNPFAECPAVVKPPGNKARRQWMRTASSKLDQLSEKFGVPSSTALHDLYQEMEAEQGVNLNEARLKALEEHQLSDCSILAAIFYDKALRGWFQARVDYYLSPGVREW